MEKQAIKIAVCVPWDSPFMWMVPGFNMMNWDRPQGSEVAFFPGVGWCPAARHNDAVAKAQDWGADIIMFNGGDHVCPLDILNLMLARINEGWDMVHAMPPSRGNVSSYGAPFKAMSYKLIGNPTPPIENAVINMPKGSAKILSYDDEPQESHVSGTGNIMMKAEILDGLEKPYFREFIKEDGRYGRHCVMDSDFVYRCTVMSGARMFCDTSIRIVHLDTFGIDETYSERFKDKAAHTQLVSGKGLEEICMATIKIHSGHREGDINFKFGESFSVPHSDTVHFDNSGDINIGEGVTIHKNVCIFTHEHDHSRNVPIAESGVIISSLDIGDDVFIGAGVIILSKVNKIGTGAVIGAGSVLTKDVGEYEIWAGNPAKFIRHRKNQAH